jgi:hypothetical protein
VIVITAKDSSVEKDGKVIECRENKMAWTPQDGGRRLIIAVGGPSHWGPSPPPLPPEATLTDLVEISTTDPDLAAQFWPPFLRYIWISAVATPVSHSWWRQQWAMTIAYLTLRSIPVRIDIPDPVTHAAVKKALERSRSPRLRVMEGTAN